MFQDSTFTIDGVSSNSLGASGISLVKVGGGETTRQVIGDRSIKKEKVNNKTYYYGIDESPIEFDLQFCLKDNAVLTETNMFALTSIFAKDKYVSFTSTDYPNTIFYVIATSIEEVKFGSGKGYFNIHLENFSSHAYRAPTTTIFDFSSTTDNFFQINATHNVGDYYYPIIEITMKDTSITLTNNGVTFGFTDLNVDEVLTIDCGKREIISSANVYRLNKMINNHNFFKLSRGINTITCDKSAILKFICQYPVYI